MKRSRVAFAVPFLAAALPVLLLSPALSVAQDAAATPDEQQVEEQWLQMKAEQGDSHASGMRPELGPVVLGNPTQAVVQLRVGLYYSYTSSGAYSEFATLHHPYADVSNTAGDVHVLDAATGKQIVAIAPGMIVRVSYDGTAYQVSLDGVPLGGFAGPVFFRPTDAANRFRIESIRRTFGTTQVPLLPWRDRGRARQRDAGRPRQRGERGRAGGLRSRRRRQRVAVLVPRRGPEGPGDRGARLRGGEHRPLRQVRVPLRHRRLELVAGLPRRDLGAREGGPGGGRDDRPRRIVRRPDHLGHVLVLVRRPQRGQRVDLQQPVVVAARDQRRPLSAGDLRR